MTKQTKKPARKLDRIGYEDREAQAEALAERVAQELDAALAERGKATLCVPGGSTPRAFLERLAAIELDWAQVTITPNDERWKPVSDVRSNEAMLRAALRGGPGAAARIQGLYTGDPTPELGLAMATAAVADLLPFDVCVIGMGADGHTASLFPGADDLAAALAPNAPPLAAIRAPGAPEPRITFTALALLGARRLHLLIAGEDKAEALEKALAPGPFEEAPIRAMLARADLVVHYAP